MILAVTVAKLHKGEHFSRYKMSNRTVSTADFIEYASRAYKIMPDMTTTAFMYMLIYVVKYQSCGMQSKTRDYTVLAHRPWRQRFSNDV